jgi:hypothetical protein
VGHSSPQGAQTAGWGWVIMEAENTPVSKVEVAEAMAWIIRSAPQLAK